MVNATTLARVKAHVGDTSSTNDALYTSLIDAVSREIEADIGYELEQKSRVEVFSLEVGEHLVFLRTIPVVSIASVKIASEGVWDFNAYDALTADLHYRLQPNGVLYLRSGYFLGRDVLQVTYTAGLGANDAAVVTAAPDLATAADIQVCEEFRRRTNPSTISRPGPGGTKTYAAPHGWLPRVDELIARHRRMLVLV